MSAIDSLDDDKLKLVLEALRLAALNAPIRLLTTHAAAALLALGYIVSDSGELKAKEQK